jgi:hypothetical protein
MSVDTLVKSAMKCFCCSKYIYINHSREACFPFSLSVLIVDFFYFYFLFLKGSCNVINKLT